MVMPKREIARGESAAIKAVRGMLRLRKRNESPAKVIKKMKEDLGLLTGLTKNYAKDSSASQ